jgi:hypothetical protein
LVDTGVWGVLMPDAAHLGLALRCRVVQVSPSHLLLQAESANAAAWQPAMAALPHGRHVLRFRVRGLRIADAGSWPPETSPVGDAGADAGSNDRAGGGGGSGGSGGGGRTLLHCGYPPAVWSVPRREVFRVAPPAQPPLRLLAHGSAGGMPWQGVVIDLGIGGLAAQVAAASAPCRVDDLLPACTLEDGRCASPPFNLRVRSVTELDPPGHWRIGAALHVPSREVVSSLQLAAYRFETAQRRQRLAQREHAGAAGLKLGYRADRR